MMGARVGEVLIGREEIAQRIASLAEEINAALAAELSLAGGGDVVVLPVLTGAMVFAADLVRRIDVDFVICPLTISSYPGRATVSKGPELLAGLSEDLASKHVLILDDILDTGRTLGLLQRLVAEQGPASVRTCVLLSKTARREVDAAAEFVGFEIPDVFVIGYGLDWDGRYRNLPDLCALAGAGEG